MPDTSPATHPSPLFTVASAPDGARWRLRLRGEFDVAGLEAAQRALHGALGERCTGLVVDLSDLTFMDSTGLRFVLCAQRLCSAADRPFAVRQGGPAIRRLFELTRLDTVVPFED
ncbi:STAS domain-containing protein [Conexibacter sp. CPCC 206217]|uniref:STAS domain-containing protein n=1 Tax=Conexibacter sp. CPCC 206217 TaxID=3064574 RepID=UPI00271B4A18|nr:STAS domain-containing protein [Conexibacter sp. CPCC 206217]MDO8208850.1 STAS domain-containing protein [Conexibacter sp. CPCC 206217]